MLELMLGNLLPLGYLMLVVTVVSWNAKKNASFVVVRSRHTNICAVYREIHTNDSISPNDSLLTAFVQD